MAKTRKQKAYAIVDNKGWIYFKHINRRAKDARAEAEKLWGKGWKKLDDQVVYSIKRITMEVDE